MVDFLSQEPEDSKSDDTKELQYYQLKLMSDSSQNVQWFDNLKQMISAQIYKEQSKKPAFCSQNHRNRAHPHGSTDTREETLAGGNREFFEIRRPAHDRKYLQLYCLAHWQICPSVQSG